MAGEGQRKEKGGKTDIQVAVEPSQKKVRERKNVSQIGPNGQNKRLGKKGEPETY